jgi:hypothetical protein
MIEMNDEYTIIEMLVFRCKIIKIERRLIC